MFSQNTRVRFLPHILSQTTFHVYTEYLKGALSISRKAPGLDKLTGAQKTALLFCYISIVDWLLSQIMEKISRDHDT